MNPSRTVAVRNGDTKTPGLLWEQQESPKKKMNKWKKRHSTHLRRQPCWVWQTLAHRNRNLKNRSRPEKFSFYFWLLFTFPGRVIRRNTIYLTSHTIPIETMMLKKSHRLLKIVIDTLKKNLWVWRGKGRVIGMIEVVTCSHVKRITYTGT